MLKITEGSILVEVWGYEQTNEDFYRVEKRSAKMVKLAPLERISQIGATLTGTALPGKVVEGPALRRKILVHQEEEMAKGQFGILRLWNGKPVKISSYA